MLAAKLGGPHPYLGLQPLFDAKNEASWFNGFDSQDELNSFDKAYKTNDDVERRSGRTKSASSR